MTSLRFLLFIALSSLAFSKPDIEKRPKFTIGETDLYLAHVSTSTDGTILNEYIGRKDKLKKWKTMFAVRYVPNTDSIDEVVERWQAYLLSVKTPGMSVGEEKDSIESDRRFSLAIRAPDDSFVESNNLRFFKHPSGKGVLFYQAAIRSNPNSLKELQRNMAFLVKLSEYMKWVNFEVHSAPLD